MVSNPSSTEFKQRAMSHCLKTLLEVDEILAQVEQMILGAATCSPFKGTHTSLSIEQTIAVENGIREVRKSMLCFVQHNGVKPNGWTVNTLWAVRHLLGSAAAKFKDIPTHSDDDCKNCHGINFDVVQEPLIRIREIFEELERELQPL